MEMVTVISLVKETFTTSEIGEQVASESITNVYALVRSVQQSEWFAAKRAAVNSKYKFIVNAFEYNDEQIVIYNNERYSIYRTYRTNADTIELYVEKKVGASNAAE